MPSRRISYVFRMECDPPLYIWSGHGSLETAADAIDVGGAAWRGAGELLSVPDIKQFINGGAGRYDFSISGVSMETVRLSTEDRPSVDGALTMLGKVEFDNTWQLTGPIEWEWTGVGGVIFTDSSPSENGRTRTISLSIASEDTRRSDPQIAFFTASDQRKKSPTDAFCDFVSSLTLQTSRRFGPK